MRVRLPLGVAGVLLALFGVYRLLTQESNRKLIGLGKWLLGALIIHDFILAPVVVAVGWVISRVVAPRARRYLQAALIMSALVTVIAIPMIYRRDSQPASKAILQQNFAGNLTLLIALIAAFALLAYAVRVARDHNDRQPTASTALPPQEHDPQ